MIRSRVRLAEHSIGQAYIVFAAQVYAELVARGVTEYDAEADDLAEARIDRFVRSTIARLGKIKPPDGRTIDGRKEIEGFPAATGALRAPLMVAMRA